MTAFAPSSTALEIATVMPRSLNDPVGLAPSYFSQTSQPVVFDSTSEWMSGVPPSSRVMTGVASVMGSRSRNSAITPRQPDIAVGRGLRLASLHAHHAGDLRDHVELAELVEGRLQVLLTRAVGDHHELRLIAEA